jgi:hypothetical protein
MLARIGMMRAINHGRRRVRARLPPHSIAIPIVPLKPADSTTASRPPPTPSTGDRHGLGRHHRPAPGAICPTGSALTAQIRFPDASRPKEAPRRPRFDLWQGSIRAALDSTRTAGRSDKRIACRMRTAHVQG